MKNFWTNVLLVVISAVLRTFGHDRNSFTKFTTTSVSEVAPPTDTRSVVRHFASTSSSLHTLHLDAGYWGDFRWQEILCGCRASCPT